MLFQKAFQIDDTNPLTMKHLADHFLFDDELDIAEALCERALRFCGKLKKPDGCDLQSFRKDIVMLSSDLSFIWGKIHHKRENYDDALKHYFQAVKLNSNNFSAQFCLAKIHFLNGNFNAVDECLNTILAAPKYKDCYEAIKLLAKVKSLQGKRFEALAHYKRVIELNPKDYQSNFEVAQMFDQVDQPLALSYYEQGLKSLSMDIEVRLKLHSDHQNEEEFFSDPINIVSPELLNNIGVLRLEHAE